jgi:hypothetical protein
MKKLIDTQYDDKRQLGEINIQEHSEPYVLESTEEMNTDASTDEEIETKIREERLFPFIDIKEVFDGGQIIYNWKRYKRVTAKIIEIRSEEVELECLVDEEKEIYQTKRISKHLFEKVSLIEGNYLLFNYYKKANEWRVEVLDDQRLFSKKSFPKIDFDRFEKSTLFND